MNYPAIPSLRPLRTINYHQSDYAELIRWRRLAVAGLSLSVFLGSLLLKGLLGGH